MFVHTPEDRGEIHESAIIDPTAELDEGVTVGPYSIVGTGRAHRRAYPGGVARLSSATPRLARTA